MGISYYRIIMNLRKSAANLRKDAMSGAADKMAVELLEARKKVVKMLATVVITFAICWAPNQFMFLAYNLGWNLDFRSWYYHVSVLTAFCNSCMNPFIYAFKNGRYRRALQKAVFGKYVCHSKVGAEEGEGATISVLNTEHVNQKRNEKQQTVPNKANTNET
ncbi:Apelin receptor [Holothuria leucospilota]|uniref:Apelin receptor n=1 Tax=Holothuria leucospilota TaxID=206669 RepID=A0A9Q0YSN9_HOLLE|nr:Apelin receptor [Holothuria leucospilota]